MKKYRVITICLIVSLLLAGCASPAPALPPSEAPAAATSTSSETGEVSPQPLEGGADALPTVAITPTQFYKVTAPLGQFSFLAPVDSQVMVMGTNASAAWDEHNLMVGIAYRPHTVEAIDPVTAVDLGILNEIGIDPGKVQVSPGDDIIVSGYPTKITNLSVEIDNAPLKGEALSIILSSHSYLFIFGMQMQVKEGQDWDRDGKMRFQQIARSVVFDPNADSAMYLRCDMAKDLEYGYKPEKAIQVGGSGNLGRYRMEIFINNLIDPRTGSALVIQPLDPIQVGAQVLYPWEFTSKGEKHTIYVDIDHYDEPKTPIDITCRGTLPTVELVTP